MLITCPKCSAKYEIPAEARLTTGKKVKCSNCQHVFVFQETNIPVDVKSVEETPEIVAIDPVPTEDVAPAQTVFADGPVFQEDMPQPFVPVATAEPESKKSVGVVALLISVVILAVLVFGAIMYRDVLFGDLFLDGTLRSAPPAHAIRSDVPQPVVAAKAEKTRPAPVAMEKYVEETPEFVLLPQIQSVRFEKRMDPVPTIRIEGVLKNMTNTAIRLPEKVRAMAYDASGIVLFEKDIYLTDSVLLAGEERPFFGSYQPAPEGVQWIDVTF